MPVAGVAGHVGDRLAEDHCRGEVVDEGRKHRRQCAGRPEHAACTEATRFQPAIQGIEHITFIEQFDDHPHEGHEGDQPEQLLFGFVLRLEEAREAAGIVEGIVHANDHQPGHHEHRWLELVHFQLGFEDDQRHANQEYRQDQ